MSGVPWLRLSYRLESIPPLKILRFVEMPWKIMSKTPMFRATIRHCELFVSIGSLGLLACLVFAGFLQGAAIKDEPFANMDFVRIEPGEFRMGCSIGDDKCGDSEKPAHMVRITRA